MNRFAAGCATYAFLLAGPVLAQSSEWEYEASIYLFMAETETAIGTPAGTVEGRLSFDDALSNLDFAFMGSFVASNGQWSLIGDYMHTDLSFSQTASGPFGSDLDSSFRTQIFSGYVGYRLQDTTDLTMDLVGGFRWFGTDSEITATTPGGASATTVADDDWIDPVIGLRGRARLSDRWAASGFVDYGGFRSDSETWQVLVTADYAINDNWVLRGGYRYISVDHDIYDNDFSFSQSGPLIGATYRF